MILRPQEYFTVVRQIDDHTDTSTYYVRAVIRNARTDEVLATLNLTDKGGLRFTKEWQVPADSSGLGYYISIVTSVYTDSGYTTKSPNYGDEENTLLVDERRNVAGGGGWSVDVDYKKIQGMIDAAVQKLQPSETDLNPILKKLSQISQAIDSIPQPEPVKIPTPKDHSAEIAAVHSAVQGIKIPEPPKPFDPVPLISEVRGLRTAFEDIRTLLRDISITQKKAIQYKPTPEDEKNAQSLFQKALSTALGQISFGKSEKKSSPETNRARRLIS